jgi:hypothetical protein
MSSSATGRTGLVNGFRRQRWLVVSWLNRYLLGYWSRNSRAGRSEALLTPFEDIPPIRLVLPELTLRQLRDAYCLDGFISQSKDCNVYLSLVEDQYTSYLRYAGCAPSPTVLRGQIAGIIHDRAEVERYIYEKVPPDKRGEPAQMEALALALAGTLIALWLVARRTSDVSRLREVQDELS